MKNVCLILLATASIGFCSSVTVYARDGVTAPKTYKLADEAAAMPTAPAVTFAFEIKAYDDLVCVALAGEPKPAYAQYPAEMASVTAVPNSRICTKAVRRFRPDPSRI